MPPQGFNKKNNLSRQNTSLPGSRNQKHPIHAFEVHYPVDVSIRSKTKVILSSEVYFKMLVHGLRYAHPHIGRDKWIEVIGLLTGRLEDFKSYDRIIVDKAWPIGHGNAVSVQIQDYGTTLSRILKEKEKKSVICGWYHTHPGYGLFMSHTDYQTQFGYQQMWNSAIALVLDTSLISTKQAGFKIFRLQRPQLNIFEILPFRIADNFSLKTFPPVLRHLSKLAKQGGRLEEYDHQIELK
ncbi:MAG: hypothetical protein ACXAC7_19810 [Candidatus Hodarchaeales archaeon]